jgi:hypothetical protein
MLDVWWNPAIEQQAFDRVYRIGQQREVERPSQQTTTLTVLICVLEASMSAARYDWWRDGSLDGKVRIYKLIAKNVKTEERILQLQERKRDIAAKAMQVCPIGI